MNHIFVEILKSPNGKEFISWYLSNYKDLETFKNLRFEQQLGTYLLYLEKVWGFSIIADNTGYITYYTSYHDSTSSSALLADRFKTNNFYHIHSVNKYDPNKTTFDYYALAIIKLFNNLDIPF